MILHALLALSGARCQRPVRVDRRLVEERIWLLLPNSQPRLVDGLHHDLDIDFLESPGEVPGGRRIRDPLRTKRVEEDLVVSPQLDVLQSRAAAGDVVGDVEDMVGLVVRLVNLQ